MPSSESPDPSLVRSVADGALDMISLLRSAQLAVVSLRELEEFIGRFGEDDEREAQIFAIAFSMGQLSAHVGVGARMTASSCEAYGDPRLCAELRDAAERLLDMTLAGEPAPYQLIDEHVQSLILVIDRAYALQRQLVAVASDGLGSGAATDEGELRELLG